MDEATRMRTLAEAMARQAQDTICGAIEALDGARFVEDQWTRAGGGGGTTRILQNGNVFERAGVGVSVVHGTLPPQVTLAAMGHGGDGREHTFFATGVSLVIHPHNPLAPTAHANYRYFQLDGSAETWWFGGGADLTPSYLFDEDVIHFHQTLRDACDRCDPAFYPRFKHECDNYFYIPHRGERRGVGGIFFDTLRDRPFDQLLRFVTGCAAAFVPSYVPLVERRKDLAYSAEQKHWQGIRRGRYVEFNLIHDRGTTFGLKTGGRVESILMSLPLVARWTYDDQPSPGSDEARLLEALRSPREWLEPSYAETRQHAVV